MTKLRDAQLTPAVLEFFEKAESGVRYSINQVSIALHVSKDRVKEVVLDLVEKGQLFYYPGRGQGTFDLKPKTTEALVPVEPAAIVEATPVVEEKILPKEENVVPPAQPVPVVPVLSSDWKPPREAEMDKYVQLLNRWREHGDIDDLTYRSLVDGRVREIVGLP